MNNFEMGKVDKTLFILRHDDDFLLVQIYVDGIIFGSSSHALISSFFETMSRKFEMSMMRELNYFLGLQIKQCKEEISIHQTKYTKDLLKRFEMGDCKPIITLMATSTALDPDEEGEAMDQREYRSKICSLLYLTASRPDIHFAVCLYARFQAFPRIFHRQAVKRIFRYLRSTLQYSIWYSCSSSLSIRGISDSDFAGCQLNRKNTSGTCHFLDTSLISWSSRKQFFVAQSTIEVEYVAAASCYSQILWMLSTLKDYGLAFASVPLLCDNTSAINIAKNSVQYFRTKHIDIRYHLLRDHIENGDIVLEFMESEAQLADIFTKPLDPTRFATLRSELGVIYPYGLV